MIMDATREILRRFWPIRSAVDMEPLAVAESRWATRRRQNGRVRNGRAELVTRPEGNVKMGKGEIPTYGLSLAPSGLSGFQVCRYRTAECDPMVGGGCLASAGKGGLEEVQVGRVIRTRFMVDHWPSFVAILVRDIDAALRRERRKGHDRIGFRLNVLSDLDWESLAPYLFDRFAGSVVFYDYTKDHGRKSDRWHLTLSASERTSVEDVQRAVDSGSNVTVVIAHRRGEPVPSEWAGRPTIDGDVTDARWTDEAGRVVLLRAKGDMRGVDVGVDRFVKPTVV